MSFSLRTAQALLNSLFGKTSNFGALATAPPIYVGISSTNPTEAGGNITEPSSGSYARVATVAGDWVAATNADPSVVANANAITFPTATADWLSAVNLAYVVLFDAASAGNMLTGNAGALTVPKPVINGDTASFAAGAITVSLD